MRQFTRLGGSRTPDPIQTFRYPYGVSDQDVRSDAWWSGPLHTCYYFEDFLGASFDTSGPASIYDASAGGTPTTALVANGTNGQYQVQLASTNEAETVGLYFGNYCNIPANRPFYFATRIKFSTDITTNQGFIAGLASAVNTTTLSSISRRVWFELSASMGLSVTYGDGTTSTTGVYPAQQITLVNSTFYYLEIERGFDGKIYYRLAAANGTNYGTYYTIDGHGLDSTNLQPVILLQKSTGTTTPDFITDFWGAIWPRI